MSELKWNYREFLSFLLLYVSHVDMEYSPEEKKMIQSRLDVKTYDRLYNEFINMTDFQALQTIMSYKGVYFPTVDQKMELLDNVKKICFVDGEFASIEKEIMHFLEKLL